MTSIRDAFMEAFDENKDDKIEIGEVRIYINILCQQYGQTVTIVI